MTITQRQQSAQNKTAQKIYNLLEQKESNLCLSLDVPQKEKFLEILRHTAEHIVILKTHIDIIEDFDWDFIQKVLILKEKHNFLIFEDRKFADIGNTVKLQYRKGLYKIIEWADLVNAHIFPGPGIIKGLRETWLETKYDRGLVLIPQMTSNDNLFDDRILTKAVEWAKEYCDFVVGFIGSASGGILRKRPVPDILHRVDSLKSLDKREADRLNENLLKAKLRVERDSANARLRLHQPMLDYERLRKLRDLTWPEFLIFTPGVQFGSKGDELGQTYVTPREAVERGADIIIVGRGIYEVKDPSGVARLYREEGWRTLKEREKKGV